MPADTLRALIEGHEDVRGQSPALLSDDGATDYAALAQAARAGALGLAALGVGPGDIVAVQLPNGPDFVQAVLAITWLGATVQTVHMPYRTAELGQLLGHSRAKVFIGMEAVGDFSPAQAVRDFLPLGPGPAHVMGLAAGGLGAALARIAPTPGPEIPPAPDADDRYLLLYTSGTTSAPKGVPIRYRNFLPAAASAARELGVDADARVLSVAPYTHLYGLFALTLTLSAGAASVCLPAFSPPALAEAMDRHRPTALFTAPAHMAALLRSGLLTPERFAGVSFVMISGSYCAPELAEAVEAALPDGEVLQLWGMSELQAGSFTRPGDPRAARLGTAGRASPATELRITRDGAPVPSGEEGDLEVLGPSVFAGYLDNPEATAEAFTPDGWFRSGDLGRLDAAGYLHLTGRSKELINRGGIKFNPVDVEAELERHPAVEACAIVPMPDPVLGERACAFVVAAPGAAPRLEDLCRHLAAAGFAKLKWPERLELLAEMPVTPTRKVMKGVLAERARGLGPAS